MPPVSSFGNSCIFESVSKSALTISPKSQKSSLNVKNVILLCDISLCLLFCFSHSVTRAHRVAGDFHARFCARSRTYVYRVALGVCFQSPVPLTERAFCWNLPDMYGSSPTLPFSICTIISPLQIHLSDLNWHACTRPAQTEACENTWIVRWSWKLGPCEASGLTTRQTKKQRRWKGEEGHMRMDRTRGGEMKQRAACGCDWKAGGCNSTFQSAHVWIFVCTWLFFFFFREK